MRIKFFTLAALTLLLTQTSYAFCVYNHTVGNDTIRSNRHGNYNAPTVITYLFKSDWGNGDGKVTHQGDFHCTIPNRRTDVSTINIFHIVSAYRNKKKFICSVNVYNKGGYVIVTGDEQTQFNCDVRRDPK